MIGRPIARRGRPGLLGTAARTAVVAGTAPAPPAAPAVASPAAPPAPQGDDLISQLRELGQLRAEGVLTEEEFAVQKSRLLTR